MYILKSLFCSIASLKLSDYELICYALQNIPLKRIRCSACGKTGHLKLHSRYSRDCIHTVHGKPVRDTVSIPLLHCSCGCFQAVLPDILIPFGSHSIRFVLAVLHAYYNRPGELTVAGMCDRDHWDISPSTLYDWKKRFETHYVDWCRACHKIRRLADAAMSDTASVPAFPESFHKLHHRCFLQCCERISSFLSMPQAMFSGSP